MRTRVTIESPFAGDRERNRIYLHRAMMHSVLLGEAPLASHMLYTQFLNDDIEAERNAGIDCGLTWAAQAEKMVFYVDYGMSNGMQIAAIFARNNNIPLEERLIGIN